MQARIIHFDVYRGYESRDMDDEEHVCVLSIGPPLENTPFELTRREFNGPYDDVYPDVDKFYEEVMARIVQALKKEFEKDK